MRAGRLVELLLLLQRRGRMNGPQLAVELEVSVRTVLRDIEALSGAGVPVRSVRGRHGGFELLEGYDVDLPGPQRWGLDRRGPATPRRARALITPEGRRLAAVLHRLQPMRVRAAPDADGWQEASFRLWSVEGAVPDVLSLGADIQVLAPAKLRVAVAEAARATAALYPVAVD